MSKCFFNDKGTQAGNITEINNEISTLNPDKPYLSGI